jgi:predicted NBD/HSP70 family sugar kinase
MAGEQIRKRLQNQDEILRALHFSGPLARFELSRRCGIRKNSVTSIVADLLQQKLLAEDTPGSYRSRLYLEPREHHVVAASVKPHRAAFGRVYLDGRIEQLGSVTLSPTAGPQKILGAVADRLEQACRRRRGSILGLGVAVCGIVNPDEGLGVFAANLPGWRDVPVRRLLFEQLGTEVHVENDVRCQLLAHSWFGRLQRAHSTLVFLSISEGLALAAMCHGRPVAGFDFAAGEIGHLRAGDEGRVCGCGRQDCLETYCALPALRREFVQLDSSWTGLDEPGAMVRLARSDARAQEVLARAAARLARVLAPAWTTLASEVIVFGSSDPELAAWLRPLVVAALREEGCVRLHDSQVVTGDGEEEGILKGIASRVISDAFATGRFSLNADAT